MPRQYKLTTSKKEIKGQKLRCQEEKKRKIVDLLKDEHNYIGLKEDPKSHSGPSLSTAAIPELNVISQLNLETENEITYDGACLQEEMVFDWTPQSPCDPEEMDWKSNFDSNHENVVLHEFSFIPEEEYNRVNKHVLEIESCSPEVPIIKGHRIVDLHYVLNRSMQIQKKHSGQCSFGQMKVTNERHTGLISILTFKCDVCGIIEECSTEDLKIEKSPLNYGAVWGTLSTGNTYTHLKELLSVLDIPCMSYKLYQQIEMELGDNFTNNLYASMVEAGQEEKKWAINNGQVGEDGILWVTVYLDGGWSHRSYGHNYNAASGVAVIIGKHTQKLLFLGVRNKYCVVCSRAANRNEEPQEHRCFKNWEASSGAMEADIIVEGFNISQDMHGLKYKRFIADGDSSVFAKIKREVTYGAVVTKVACKNHAVKNVGKALYNCSKSLTAAARKLLTKKKIKDIQNCVMKMLYINAHGDVEKLKHDIGNTADHIYGDHTNCSLEYCSNVGAVHESRMSQVKSSGLIYHINSALEKLQEKGHQLIDNETNNRAELYMSLLCKFNAAKRLNLTGRGSFQTRSMMSGLRYNMGPDWQIQEWENIMGSPAGDNFKKLMAQNKRALHLKGEKPRERPPSKRTATIVSQSTDYGKMAEQPPLSQLEFDSEKERILNSLKVIPEEILNIEQRTVGQWGNRIYEAYRRNRLTASVFGSVCRRRSSTSCKALVKRILNPVSWSTEATKYGQEMEDVARQKFADSRPKYSGSIRKCGLFIDAVYPHLAASPDGLVGDNGLVEIKCLYKLHKKGQTLEDAITTDHTICLEKIDEKIRLKKKHDYYYQIQGQLNIAKKDLCFFIIYINDREPLHVEAILRDKELWENEMLPKLNYFYMNCVLPNITDKNRPCLDPKHK